MNGDSADKVLAVKTLREICENERSPAQAKATAARTLLELSGDIGKLQSERPRETRALHELTREELDAEIARVAEVHESTRKYANANESVDGVQNVKPNGAELHESTRTTTRATRAARATRATRATRVAPSKRASKRTSKRVAMRRRETREYDF